jgi:hypothetical protein
MGLNSDVVLNSDKNKFMAKGTKIRNVRAVHRIQKVETCTYLGFKLNFNFEKIIKFAKDNVKINPTPSPKRSELVQSTLKRIITKLLFVSKCFTSFFLCTQLVLSLA